MQLAFHGATTMTSDLQTDMAASRKSGGSRVNVVFFGRGKRPISIYFDISLGKGYKFLG
jgi:hypothetical protein